MDKGSAAASAHRPTSLNLNFSLNSRLAVMQQLQQQQQQQNGSKSKRRPLSRLDARLFSSRVLDVGFRSINVSNFLRASALVKRLTVHRSRMEQGLLAAFGSNINIEVIALAALRPNAIFHHPVIMGGTQIW